jgi:thiamine-phosphate pyrophosphorylase
VPLIINDRVDVALAIDADGVHVGQSDMPCDVTRKLVGPNKIVGVSAATIDEAKKAEKDGADYIGTGAVFPTSTKDDAPKITKKELKEVVDSINIPVVAIGGITIDNASELIDTGIAGLSVVSAIMSSDDPKKSSEMLLNIFNS